MAMSETKYTFCHICEATCGLEVTVEGNRVVKLQPDREHVVSRGFACIKGTRFRAVQESPDRILRPMKRQGEVWREISWDQAIGEIGAKVRELVARHGKQTVAHMMGSPAGVSVVNPIFRKGFYDGIGSKQMYGVGSIDCNNKFRVNEELYGSAFRLTFPDVDHTQFLMVLGANPAVSGTSLVHVPRAVERFREILKRGGRVVCVNPRRTETAERVGAEQAFIRPDTDVFFLAAFCRELIARGGVDRERVEAYMTGFEALELAVSPWTPERAEKVSGIPAEKLREWVDAHIAANGAALYMSTGINQGTHGSLCYWLLEAINAISGNLDRRGGNLMGRGIFDWPAEAKKTHQFEMWRRSDGFPAIVDTYPTGLLPDEILKPSEDRVTALFVEASNPVLNCANPNGKIEEAFRKLELIVSIDLFRNETGNYAHYILPAPTFLERAGIPYAIQSFAGSTPTRYIHYVDPALDPPEGVREEWWIFTRLAKASGVKLFDSYWADLFFQLNASLFESKWGRKICLTPARLMSMMLRRAGVGSRRTLLREYPHGRLLEPNQPGTFLGTDLVLTEDRKVHLAPVEFIESMGQLEAQFQCELKERDGLKLISKRELGSLNSWLRNFDGYVKDKTNYLYLHPEDATRIGVKENDLVEVASAHGKVRVPVRVSDEMMPRTVALPHGWGHAKSDGLPLAQQHAGVNSNLLAGDGPDNVERLSGMSHLSGIPVTVSKLGSGTSHWERGISAG